MNKKYYIAVAIVALIITTAGISLVAEASERRVVNGNLPAITEEMKANFDEVKSLHESGDHESAQALAEELGLPMFKGKMNHRGGNDAMRDAMDLGDYNAWISAHEETGRTDMIENINEETFNQMVEVHQLKKSGDFEGAQALAEEYDLKMFCQKRGMHKGLGGCDCQINE